MKYKLKTNKEEVYTKFLLFTGSKLYDLNFIWLIVLMSR